MTNFYTTTSAGASLEEIAAVFQEGLDAIYDAHDAGEDTDLAFLSDIDYETHNNKDNVATIEEDVIVCPECIEGPCLFIRNKQGKPHRVWRGRARWSGDRRCPIQQCHAQEAVYR